jgi:hypothetical protein
LLLQSVERCDALNTHLSATFRVAGKNVCVRDGGEWRDCREVLGLGGGDVALGLQRFIEKEYKKLSTSNRVLSHIFQYSFLLGYSFSMNTPLFLDIPFWEYG